MGSKGKIFSLPDKVQISTIYLDESGTRNPAQGIFVVGFLKVRNGGTLARDVMHLRQKHKYHDKEIHFSKIAKKQLAFYFDLVEVLASADVRVGASVYDSSFQSTKKATWEQQADMAALLVRGNINKGELVNIFLDLVQTPKGVSAAIEVKETVNREMGSRCVLEAYDVDSQSTDLIQLADLVAGSITLERRNGNYLKDSSTPKAQVAKRLRRALDLDSFDDIQLNKVNIQTFGS